MLRCGGEIYKRDASLQPDCLQERLEMKVALPYLWGVPPAYDALRFAPPPHPPPARARARKAGVGSPVPEEYSLGSGAINHLHVYVLFDPTLR